MVVVLLMRMPMLALLLLLLLVLLSLALLLLVPPLLLVLPLPLLLLLTRRPSAEGVPFQGPRKLDEHGHVEEEPQTQWVEQVACDQPPDLHGCMAGMGETHQWSCMRGCRSDSCCVGCRPGSSDLAVQAACAQRCAVQTQQRLAWTQHPKLCRYQRIT